MAKGVCPLLLITCYFIIETKQKQNITVNVALGVYFKPYRVKMKHVLLSKSSQISKESKS